MAKEVQEAQASQPIDAEQITKELQQFIKTKFKADLPADKLRGVVFETLKDVGATSKDDRYANYEHVIVMMDTLNNAFDDIFELKDVEHFTGNLMYAMRLGTRKPIEDVEKLVKEYSKNYLQGNKIVVDKATFDTDMMFLTTQIKRSMSETWKYIEQTQVKGVSMIVSKVLKYILKKQQ